ncbi:MAG: hypothetical protein HPY64_04815 [Anaerolineae bacterium]|nr:hypothetical protein [Anaerolineae bacterium]
MTLAVLASLGMLGPASVAVTLVVIGLLSQRLGAVTRTPPYYRWCYVAAGLVGVSTLGRLVSVGYVDERLTLLNNLLFALGVTLGLVVAWRYWSWLFGERQR